MVKLPNTQYYTRPWYEWAAAQSPDRAGDLVAYYDDQIAKYVKANATFGNVEYGRCLMVRDSLVRNRSNNKRIDKMSQM